MKNAATVPTTATPVVEENATPAGQVESRAPAPDQVNGGNVPTYYKDPGVNRRDRADDWNSKVPGLANPPGERRPTGFDPEPLQPGDPEREVPNANSRPEGRPNEVSLPEGRANEVSQPDYAPRSPSAAVPQRSTSGWFYPNRNPDNTVPPDPNNRGNVGPQPVPSQQPGP